MFFKHFCRHIPQPSHRNVCDFIWCFFFLFWRNNLRSDSVRSAFHLPGKWVKRNHTERTSVCMTFPFVCRSGKQTGGQSWNTHKKWQGKCCVQSVLLLQKRCWNVKLLLSYFFVIACEEPDNLAFNVCLHFKFPEFSDSCDLSDMRDLLVFSSWELHGLQTLLCTKQPIHSYTHTK